MSLAPQDNARTLNSKQRIFVREYLIDKNATRAAKAAGYSFKTAAAIGAENLTKPNIARAIESGLRSQMKATEITAERVLNRIAEIAFSKESIRPLDALKACELLGKHFGLFEDRTAVEVVVPPPVSIIDKEKVKEILEQLEADI